MKIYSITEILQASDNILNRNEKEIVIKKKNDHDKTKIVPLLLSDPVKDNDIKKENNSNLNKKNLSIKSQALTLNNIETKNHEKYDNSISNEEIINELYSLLNKKFRKITSILNC